ncbi:hypothetical protein [Variovorax sp. J31P179]|uniref:hypothetical protein n=1 Tax=Variovorax sp. J31P179 TaxID=3053508 RepID=UPI002574ECE4|nr:hypothetical protein [Variovorax sp. J31P179]
MLATKAGKHHGVKALTDVVGYCIHATDCTDAAEVDKVLIIDRDNAQMASMVEVLQ